MIYDTIVVSSLYPMEFQRALQQAIDRYQADNLEVEVQYAVVSSCHSALIITRSKP